MAGCRNAINKIFAVLAGAAVLFIASSLLLRGCGQQTIAEYPYLARPTPTPAPSGIVSFANAVGGLTWPLVRGLTPLLLYIFAAGLLFILLMRLYKNANLVYPNEAGQYPVIINRGGLVGMLSYALFGRGIIVYHNENKAPGPTTAYARNGATQPVGVQAPITVPETMQERTTARAQAALMTASLFGPQGQRMTAPMLRVLTQGDIGRGIGEDEGELPQLASLPGRVMVYDAQLDGQLCLPLGVGAQGPVYLPFRNLGCGIIGGLTGKGKSELLAAMIASLLLQDPLGKRVRLAFTDMKGGLDFGRIPDDLALLQWPIAKDAGAANILVQALAEEVNRRMNLLDDAGVPNIEKYNEQRGGQGLPYMFGLFDEVLMLTGPVGDKGMPIDIRRQAEGFIRCAWFIENIGRAVGVFMGMTAQKPSADVIPTMLRDLCPWRIAFRCSNVQSSTAVLGVGGAELLPDIPGRCLVFQGGEPQPMQAYMGGIEDGVFDDFVRRQPRATMPPAMPQLTGLASQLGQLLQPPQLTTAEIGSPLAVATNQPLIAKGRQPTPEQAAEMRQLFQSGVKLTHLCFRFYGYKDGDTFNYVKAAVGAQ